MIVDHHCGDRRNQPQRGGEQRLGNTRRDDRKIGGLLLGVIEIQSVWYLGTEYRDLAAYLLLFLFLVLRPGGIMGQLKVRREQAAARRV